MKSRLKKIMVFLTIPLLAFLNGCSMPPKEPYRIAIDPIFFPLNFKNQSINVFAFSNDLLKEISKQKKLPLIRVNVSWDNILEGLNSDKYDAILSPLPPTLMNCDQYNFSIPYLETGPVLVTQKKDKHLSLSDFSNRVVAIERDDTQIELISKHPEIQTIFYQNVPETLNRVAQGEINAALIPSLPAHAYVQDLYKGRLAIVSKPLTNQALRLVTPNNKNKALMDLFNSAIKEFKENGTYDRLLEKWLPKQS